jgi:DNA-binding response OmpR family regulator
LRKPAWISAGGQFSTTGKEKKMDSRILVVEDDSYVLDLLVKAFSRSDFYVDTAGDIDQAMTLLGARTYDVLITDKNLGGDEDVEEGGMQLLRQLRQQGSRTQAIMITGYATIDTAIEAMRLGAFDYILKPFSMDTLREKVDRILEFRKFLNPDNTIKSFKEFHNELLNVFENRAQEISPATQKAIESILAKVENFFTVQKERERIMIEQREAMAEIASDAEELREKLFEQGESHDLLERICSVANRRF